MERVAAVFQVKATTVEHISRGSLNLVYEQSVISLGNQNQTGARVEDSVLQVAVFYLLRAVFHVGKTERPPSSIVFGFYSRMHRKRARVRSVVYEAELYF